MRPPGKYDMFDKIYNLECVPIATVQLRFNGWVTEMGDSAKMRDVSGDQSDGRGAGIDNLLDKNYSEHLNLAGSAGFADYGLEPTSRVNEPGRTYWARVDMSF